MAARTSQRRAAALALLLAAALQACGGGEPGFAPPRNVLLISLDTLRADRCGFLGCERPTTPFLDELAARGVVFERHMANSNNTLISHASILTGLVAPFHRTYDYRTPGQQSALAPAIQTVAEAFRAGGFATVAYTAHPAWLGDAFGLQQGFQELRSDWADAPTINKRFLGWLGRRKDEAPFFAFLHYYDAHSEIGAVDARARLPYDATPELVERFAGAPPEGFTGCAHGRPGACASEYLQLVSAGDEPMPPEHLRYIRDLYDAGIAKLDGHLRELFDELGRRGVLDDTLVVVTSDHGEEFLEHGQMLHYQYFDEIMHVPLLVVLPGEGAPARRVRGVTRSIDVAPTLLELAGLPPIGHGSSLVPSIARGADPEDDEVLFNRAVLRASDARSTFKYCDAEGRRTFHDLDADPREQRDLLEDGAFAGGDPERLERIQARVERWRRDAELFTRRLGERTGPDQAAGDLEALKRLGY